MSEVKGGQGGEQARGTRVICGTSRGATICISLTSCNCPQYPLDPDPIY